MTQLTIMNANVVDLETQIRSMESEIERVLQWTKDSQSKLKRVQDEHDRIGNILEQVTQRKDDIDDGLESIRVDKHPKYLQLLKELASLENESEEDRKSDIHNFVEYANRSSRNVYTFGHNSPYSTSFAKTETDIVDKESLSDSRPTSSRDVEKKKKTNTDWLRRMREKED